MSFHFIHIPRAEILDGDGRDGTYQGKSAHGGLDISIKSGTPLFAPIAIDRHTLFDSLLKGDNNNRWRVIRQWKNGCRPQIGAE